MIRGVLWDFGGVFIGTPLGGVADYAADLGVDPDELFELVLGPRDVDTDHPWHRIERGELALTDGFAAITGLVADAGLGRFEGREFFMRMAAGEREVRPEVVRAVRRVGAAGLRQAIVTNNIAELSGAWRSMLPVDELFDAVIDSSSEGVRKPSPAIYLTALERLGIEAPDEAVFLDDLPANIAGADAVGLRTVHVGQPVDVALAELGRLLGLDLG